MIEAKGANAGIAAVTAGLALLASLLAGTPAVSQTPIAGNYGLGAGLGQTAAIQAPEGTTIIENGWISYNIERFKDADGNEIDATSTQVHAVRLAFQHVFSGVEILGANYGAGLVLTYRDQVLRPEPGSDTAYQVGDTILMPIALGWHSGAWHSQFSYSIWLPTGKFEEGGSTNTGKGLYSHMIMAGTTWRQQTDLPWAATFMARYETFGKQQDTDIRPGDVFSLEAAVGKEVAAGVNLGLLAATSRQVSQQSGTPGGDPEKYQINLAGGEVVWKPKGLPGAQIALRAAKEFDNVNTTEGFSTLLSLAYAF